MKKSEIEFSLSMFVCCTKNFIVCSKACKPWNEGHADLVTYSVRKQNAENLFYVHKTIILSVKTNMLGLI